MKRQQLRASAHRRGPRQIPGRTPRGCASILGRGLVRPSKLEGLSRAVWVAETSLLRSACSPVGRRTPPRGRTRAVRAPGPARAAARREVRVSAVCVRRLDRGAPPPGTACAGLSALRTAFVPPAPRRGRGAAAPSSHICRGPAARTDELYRKYGTEMFPSRAECHLSTAPARTARGRWEMRAAASRASGGVVSVAGPQRRDD
eukprot:2932040-Prymnesium_polylepis.2